MLSYFFYSFTKLFSSVKLRNNYNTIFLFSKFYKSPFWISFVKLSEMTKSENLKIYKINSKVYPNIFTPELIYLKNLFEKNNYLLRIAGGAVRDILSNKLPDDIDFASDATPDEMLEMFNRENIRILRKGGVSHGTIAVRINDLINFEITTLRIDKLTDGRHAEVVFTKDWLIDASRRDLTINAMFADFNGNIYDYFSGVEDLNNRVIKFVGDDSERRIQEDYLRILRYFRFFATVSIPGDDFNQESIDVIKDNLKGLSKISGERIWIELSKISCTPLAYKIITKMLEIGVGEHLGICSPIQNIDLSELNRICIVTKKLISSKDSFKPMIVYAALFNTMEESDKFVHRIKASNLDKFILQFCILYRNIVFPSQISVDMINEVTFSSFYQNYSDLRPIFDLLLDKKSTKYLEALKEYFKYMNMASAAKNLDSLILPVFHLKGSQIISAYPDISKRHISSILNLLREKWKKSFFTASTQSLLTRCIIDEVLNEIYSSNDKKLAANKRHKF